LICGIIGLCCAAGEQEKKNPMSDVLDIFQEIRAPLGFIDLCQ